MSTFELLSDQPRLRDLVRLAEADAYSDPSVAVFRIRLFCELLTNLIWEPRVAAGTTARKQQALHEQGVLPEHILEALIRCRRAGNDAVHGKRDHTPEEVLELLPLCFEVARWFVERDGITVDEHYRIPAAAEPSTPEHQEARVRQALVDSEITVPMLGMAPRVHASPANVDQVFVPPDLGEDMPWSDLRAALAKGGRYAIAASAGHGKSTLCRRLLSTMARDECGPVPLFLPLSQVGGPLLASVVRRARMHLHVRLESTTVEAWLSSGRAVLILDGLDETSRWEQVSGALKALCKRYPAAGILVTSRPTALDRVDLAGFDVLRIAGWTTLQAYALFERLLDADRAEALYRRLWSSDILAELASNPLMATLVAFVYREHGDVTERREELLDLAVRTFLDTWPQSRARVFADWPIADQLSQLQALAEGTLDPAFDGRFSSMRALLDRGVDGERWLEHLIDEVGLLVRAEADHYRFVHDVLRDHLALEHLRTRTIDLAEYVAERLPDRRNERILADLVQGSTGDTTLAKRLIRRLKGVQRHESKPWYGASEAWWTFWLVRCAENGLSLDDEATDALLDVLAEDRLRIVLAMDHQSPFLFGDENWHIGRALVDSGHHFMGRRLYSPDLQSIIPEHRIQSWASRRLRSNTGEHLAAIVVFALDYLREDEILGAVRDRVGELYCLWPRTQAGRVSMDGTVREMNAPWPGDALSLRAGRETELAEALRTMEGKADWFSRSVLALALEACSGVMEAICCLVVRQTAAAGTVCDDLTARSRDWVLATPRRSITVLPSTGLRARPGTAAPPERFRGLLRASWIHPSLEPFVYSSGLRTPSRVVVTPPWPDTGPLDAVSVEEVAASDGLIAELAERCGLRRAEMYQFSEDMEYLQTLTDAIPMLLVPQAEISRLEPPMRSDSADLRSVWLAEIVAASVATRGLSELDRLGHLQQRLQCRATFELWPRFDPDRSVPPASEALLAAMLWAQMTISRTWPPSRWVDAFLARPPGSWQGRAFWHLCHLSAGCRTRKGEQRHRRRLSDALRRGGAHPLAVLLRGGSRAP